ncbi:MAG: hypothetical protein AAF493_19240 [Pseudomonadota bacterium]
MTPTAWTRLLISTLLLVVLAPVTNAAHRTTGKTQEGNLALRTETGIFVNSESDRDLSNYIGGSLSIDFRPAAYDWLEGKIGLRGDVFHELGGPNSFGDAELDYDEIYVRARLGESRNTRVTLGAQRILWGRVDELPPTDRLSVQDVSRYILDQLPDRRRTTPALRVEHSMGEWMLDSQFVPFFRPAELADHESVWFPVNQRRGRILGIDTSNAVFAAGIRNGTVGDYDDYNGFGGFGLRLTRQSDDADYGIAVQRARHSLPYYELNRQVRAAALSGTPLGTALMAGTPTLKEVHPLTWVFSGDVVFDAYWFDMDWTVRFEAAYVSDVPITEPDLLRASTDAVEWVAGLEFFPGDTDLRVNLQLADRILLTDDSILDEDRITSVNGEVEYPFLRDRFRWTTRFSVGLEFSDWYLNTELRYVGAQPHEFYVGAHVFSGEDKSPNGFFSANDLVTLGWRARF